MQTFLIILLVLVMLATVGVLLAGLLGLVRGTTTPEQSNTLMRWRIIAQAGALALFMLLLSLIRH